MAGLVVSGDRKLCGIYLRVDGERPVRQSRNMKQPRHNLVGRDCIEIRRRIECRATEM